MVRNVGYLYLLKFPTYTGETAWD